MAHYMEISEKQLIAKIQELKRIKPEQEWAVLAKSRILEENKAVESPILRGLEQKRKVGILSVFPQLFRNKMPAYAFASFLFFVAGVFGLMILSAGNEIKVAEKSPAALVVSEAFKEKSQNVVDAAKHKPQNFSLAIEEFKSAAKNLTQAIEKNPEMAKEVAMEVKNSGTLLSVVSEAETEEALASSYKAVVKPVLNDLNSNKENLTQEQQKDLAEANDLYENGDYSQALEKVLLISK